MAIVVWLLRLILKNILGIVLKIPKVPLVKYYLVKTVVQRWAGRLHFTFQAQRLVLNSVKYLFRSYSYSQVSENGIFIDYFCNEKYKLVFIRNILRLNHTNTLIAEWNCLIFGCGKERPDSVADVGYDECETEWRGMAVQWHVIT